MKPFKYLDIENYDIITEKLRYYILNSLYLNQTEKSDINFTFTKRFDGQPLYDIRSHKTFWNFLDFNDVLNAIPELNVACQKLDISPFNFNLIVIPRDYGELHSDAQPDKASFPFRINWPVHNCDSFTKVRFFKLKTNKTINTNYVPPNATVKEETPTSIYDKTDIDHALGYYILTKPVLINYLVPHAVEFPKGFLASYPRVIMSIDFHSETLNLE